MVKRLLQLNGLAILGVILFHATGWGFTALFAWKARYVAAGVHAFQPMGSASYYALRVVEQLVVASLPAFLFVSGYFMAVAAGRRQTTVGWKVVGARVKNLLKPYLIWSVAVMAFTVLEGKRHSTTGYAVMLLTGGASPAYYYAILLSQLYLVSPFLIPLARNRARLLLFVAGAIQLVILILQYPVFLGINMPALNPVVDAVPKWVFLTRIFWFSFGIVAGFHVEDLKAWARRYRRALFVVLLVSAIAAVFEWETYFRMSGLDWLSTRETLLDWVYSGTVLLCFIGFDRLQIPFARQMGELGARSYGIYLAHVPAMELAARAAYHIVPLLLAYQFAMQPLIIGVGLALPLLAMEIVKRSPARGYYQYLFG